MTGLKLQLHLVMEMLCMEYLREMEPRMLVTLNNMMLQRIHGRAEQFPITLEEDHIAETRHGMILLLQWIPIIRIHYISEVSMFIDRQITVLTGHGFQIGDRLHCPMCMLTFIKYLMLPQAVAVLQLDVMVASFILLTQMLLLQTLPIRIQD